MPTIEHMEVVENYVDAKLQIKALELKAKLIQDEVLAIVKEAGGKLEFNGAVLATGTRKKWEYPSAIADMDDALKQAKKNAETDGDATFTESDYVICKG
jgi:hypothetical protein